MEFDPLLDFPPALFARRRARALERLGSDAMVLPAAPPLIRGLDSELPYRPDSELFYLTGCREPEALLVLRGHTEEERAILYVRPRDPGVERWTGPRLGPARAGELLEMEEVRSSEKTGAELADLLKGAERIHFRLGRHPRVESAVVEALRHARGRGARKGEGPRGVMDPGLLLDELRLRKAPEELEALRQAVSATVAGFQAAFRRTEPGAGEWDVEAALVAGFRQGGAGGPAFSPIVASGRNACVLHYLENQRRMQAGELVLVDAGAEVRLYSADITRTIPADGRYSPVQREVYHWVEEARRAAVAAVAPGVPVDRLHRAAVETLVRGLVEMGVLEGEVEELMKEGAHRDWFPHQTSHWLGLDTHDPGSYAVDGEPRILEAGMVLTVEPGLYFPPPGFVDEAGEGGQGGVQGDVQRRADSGASAEPDRAAPYRGIGIRIEDDVLVTPEGGEVLTAALPTHPDAIEELLKDSASSSP